MLFVTDVKAKISKRSINQHAKYFHLRCSIQLVQRAQHTKAGWNQSPYKATSLPR